MLPGDWRGMCAQRCLGLCGHLGSLLKLSDIASKQGRRSQQRGSIPGARAAVHGDAPVLAKVRQHFWLVTMHTACDHADR